MAATDSDISGRLASYRWVLILLPALALLIGGAFLARSLPYDYYPYFWDGAQLLQEAGDEYFDVAGPLVSNRYTLRKYLYSAQVHHLLPVFGFASVLVVNLFWYGIILALGIWTLARRRDGGAFPWAGVLTYCAGIVTIPFVHKYIGLANPTIQSLALWTALFLFYDRQYRAPSSPWQGILTPGILSALLVVTDFPKWAVILPPALFLTELISARENWGWWRRLRTAVLRSVAIMGIALAGFAVPVWLVPNYLRNNVFVTLFGGPGNAEVIRPALSWNFAIFLWILGGVWLVAYVVLFYRRTIGRALWQSRGVVLALSVVAVFSFLIWPRAARMFAVVMPFAILLFGRIVQWLYESPADEHGNGQSVRRRTWAFAGAVVVLCVLVARGFVAGSCYIAPTGIRKVNQFIARDSRTVPDTLFGTYVEPLFTLGVTPGRQWRQVPAYMWSDMQWVCSGDIIDEMILEEVFAHGTVPVSWRTHQTHMLDKFRQEPRIAQFPNDFYASKWYLSEAAIEDSYLTFMLRRAAEIKEPMWHLHFVGGLAGDSLRTPVVSDSAATLP